MIDALQRALGLSDKLGIYAVEVDAIDQQAKTFYEKYGFVPLLDNEFHLFLPITTIQTAIRRPDSLLSEMPRSPTTGRDHRDADPAILSP